MPLGFAHNPDPADRDPRRRPQTVTVSDANGTRTMTLEEYRASERGQAAARRALTSGEIGGRHPDIVFGAPEGRAQSPEEQAYRRNYNEANRGRAQVTGLDALGNVAAIVATAAAGGVAGGWSPGGAGGAGGGLGVFSNGGVNGLAGVGGGNAGALASSGSIAGGAGVHGTTAGALGGLSGAANSLSGVGSTGGGGMGWNWGDIFETAAPIIGGLLEREGSSDAARQQTRANDAAIAEWRRQYDQTRTDTLPWLEAGRGALANMRDPNAFQASPGYGFVRDEGMRGIENSFAARGGAASGNALRRLAEFNAGLASQEYGNWWNREAGVAGVGQTAAQNLGALGANTAGNVGNAMMDSGSARASGVAGQTNAWTNMLQNLSSTWARRNQSPQTGYSGPNVLGGSW